jgi:ATP-binding protein involved in chromosome partitioning
VSVTREQVLAALREVMVPGTRVDIVKVDLVGEIRVEDGEVLVEIVRTSEKPQTIAAVRQAALTRLEQLPGIRSLSVEVDDRSAPKRQAPTGPHGQSPDPWAEREPLPGVGRIIAVASAKGGVGKSTVAVNLALALAEAGHRTGLLDADIYGPSLPTMLPVSEPAAVDPDRKIHPGRALDLAVLSMGLLVDPDQAMIWRGPMVFSAVKQLLKDTVWPELDYLVVDLPPGTGDAQLTLVQQVPLAGVVMVTTPQEVALVDVRRGVEMFRKVEVPVLGIVENMSFFVCPDTGKQYDIFGRGGGQRVADQFDLPLLAQIPIEPAIREGGDTGRPVMMQPGESATHAAVRQLAGEVHARAVDPPDADAPA